MQYEKFEEWMIGKQIKFNGIHGTVTRPYRIPHNNALYALWDEDMEENWVFIEDIEFIEEPSTPEEKEMILEMNGKRYRLVEIKE